MCFSPLMITQDFNALNLKALTFVRGFAALLGPPIAGFALDRLQTVVSCQRYGILKCICVYVNTYICICICIQVAGYQIVLF